MEVVTVNSPDARERRSSQLIADIFNSLIRKRILYRTGPSEWDLDLVNSNSFSRLQGRAGPAGPAGQNGSSWIVEDGSPTNNAGTEGDFYINALDGSLWHKESSAFGVPPQWEQVSSLVGPTGEPGASGSDGRPGRDGGPGKDGVGRIGAYLDGGTVGSVLFVGAGGLLSQDNTNFFWDDTNNRLGIGTSSLYGAKVNILSGSATEIGEVNRGAASQSANRSEWQNSSGTVVAQMGPLNSGADVEFRLTRSDNSNHYLAFRVFDASGEFVIQANERVLRFDLGSSATIKFVNGAIIDGVSTARLLDFAGPSNFGMNSATLYTLATSNQNATDFAFAIAQGSLSLAKTARWLAGGKIEWDDGAGGAVWDTNLYRSAANILATDDVFYSSNVRHDGNKRLTSNATNATTTMSNLTDLSVTLVAGRKYQFKLILFVANALAADGVKIDFDGGTATMTSFRAHGTLFDTALLLSSQTSALATDFAVATVTGDAMAEIHGALVCNAAGTFIPRMAKNADAAGATLTVYLNSFLLVQETAN